MPKQQAINTTMLLESMDKAMEGGEVPEPLGKFISPFRLTALV